MLLSIQVPKMEAWTLLSEALEFCLTKGKGLFSVV
jgi:hypothetical protein